MAIVPNVYAGKKLNFWVSCERAHLNESKYTQLGLGVLSLQYRIDVMKRSFARFEFNQEDAGHIKSEIDENLAALTDINTVQKSDLEIFSARRPPTRAMMIIL